MFIHYFPILSILIWTPIIGSLLLLLIKENDLPLILANDPVVKKIEAVKGDVLKIKRESLTAGESTYYRIVV